MSKEWRADYRMSEEERRRGTALLKLGALVLYAFPGSPTIYYGDEVGLEGFEDPFNRRTFPWGSEDKALTRYFAALGKARNEQPALQRGELRWLKCQGRLLVFERILGKESVIAAVNAGDKRAVLQFPKGGKVTLEPMQGHLLTQREGEMITIF